MRIHSLDAEQLNSNEETYFWYQSGVTISSPKKVFADSHLEEAITAWDIFNYMKSVSVPAIIWEGDISMVFQPNNDIQLKVFLHFWQILISFKKLYS